MLTLDIDSKVFCYDNRKLPVKLIVSPMETNQTGVNHSKCLLSIVRYLAILTESYQSKSVTCFEAVLSSCRAMKVKNILTNLTTIVLLICFGFYVKDQIVKFFSGKTTESIERMVTQVMQMPSLSLCTVSGYKEEDITFENIIQRFPEDRWTDQTAEELFRNFTFTLGIDFEIFFRSTAFNSEQYNTRTKLKVG